MSGLVLRLAAPMQSWGERSVFNRRDTVRFPTRSGLIGLLAAAEGRPRGASLADYDRLMFTVRIDRPGVPLADFHTIGGGRAKNATVPTADGKRRPEEAATIVTRRHYLSDAVFMVAVTGPEELTRRLGQGLGNPRWPLYLGRRSCPPAPPLLLRADAADPVADLTDRVPVHGRPRADTGNETPNTQDNDPPDDVLEFVTEDEPRAATTVTTLADVPDSFARLDRRYRTRTVSVAPRNIPARLWHAGIREYRQALLDYMGVAASCG